MTDFVVSKVVMSVCALLVAGGLAGALEASTSQGPGEDLGEVLAALQEAAASLAAIRGECRLLWQVPALPSGDGMELRIDGGSAMATSGGASRTADVRPAPHTWEWDGRPLDSTALAALDLTAPALCARSGEALWLETLSVPLDDSEESLLFVRLSGP